MAMIRSLQHGDRDELLRMRQSIWPDSTAKEVDDLIDSENADHRVFVAVRDGDGLCGFAEVGLRPYAEGCLSSPVGYLEGIWVDPDRRRLSVATSLVRAAEEWTVRRGCTELASDCALDNESSKQFHRGVGFTEAGRIICYRRDLAT